MKFIFSSILLMLLATNIASAHGAGLSLEAIDGNYRLDVGYTGELSTEAPVLFDFSLLNEATGAEERFDSVWVRLGDEREVYLSTRLHGGSSDKTILNYKFVNSGEYTMLVRYSMGGEAVAEHSFPLVVAGEPQDSPSLPKGMIVSLVIGFFAGALLTRLFF